MSGELVEPRSRRRVQRRRPAVTAQPESAEPELVGSKSAVPKPAGPAPLAGVAPKRRRRAPQDTRAALLKAAVAEFAREGYGGARVDRISTAARSNDRMLYYYFHSKEELFRQVIEHCYAQLVAKEEALELDVTRPREALAALVAFNWDYYWKHPELISILASENLFKGRHVKNKIRAAFASSQFFTLERILDHGAKSGVFRQGCDSFLVYMSILSLTYFYRSNLHTLSNYMQVDLAEPARRDAWLAHVQRMIDDLVRRRQVRSRPALSGG